MPVNSCPIRLNHSITLPVYLDDCQFNNFNVDRLISLGLNWPYFIIGDRYTWISIVDQEKWRRKTSWSRRVTRGESLWSNFVVFSLVYFHSLLLTRDNVTYTFIPFFPVSKNRIPGHYILQFDSTRIFQEIQKRLKIYIIIVNYKVVAFGH